MLHCLTRPLCVVAFAGSAAAATPTLSPDQMATERTARIPLPATLGDASMPLTGFEQVVDGRTPNYLLMMSLFPEGPERMADMARSVLYGGALDPTLKMAMGHVIADQVGSPYTRAHMARLLGATSDGRSMLNAISRSDSTSLDERDATALKLARTMVTDVNGFRDDEFRHLRSLFSEPEIVELTLVSCFFDYFARLVEVVNLPIEPWALSAARSLPEDAAVRTRAVDARIGLLSNEEVSIIAERLSQSEGSSSLGLRIANSVRAMARVPHIRTAWGNLSISYEVIPPVVQHHISNTVSYQNGCLYCKTHQVQKLARSGLSIERIAAIIDNERLLSDPEQLAVRFARTLTIDPSSVRDEDFRRLRETFTDRGAMEVLIVAARFNFMNRFTGSLRLPPEDAPRDTYERIEQARTR